MKQLLIIITAMVLVGCVPKQLQKTKAIPIQQVEPPTTKAPEISIHAAAHQGNIEAVKKHIASGTDVNAKNSGGWTSLHSVATKEIAELLISRGPEVNAKGKIGITPLDLASRQPEIAALLRKHGGKTKKELEAAGN